MKPDLKDLKANVNGLRTRYRAYHNEAQHYHAQAKLMEQRAAEFEARKEQTRDDFKKAIAEYNREAPVPTSYADALMSGIP